jgi:hypothetical protein
MNNVCQRFTLFQTRVLSQPHRTILTHTERTHYSLPWLTKPGRGAEVSCESCLDRLISNLKSQAPSPPSSDNDEDDYVAQGQYAFHSLLTQHPDMVLVTSPPQTPRRQRIVTQVDDNMVITLPATIAALSTLTLTITPRGRPQVTTSTRPNTPQTPTRSRPTVPNSPTSSGRRGGRSRSSAGLSSTGSSITEVSNRYLTCLFYLLNYTDIRSYSCWPHATGR